MAAPIDGPISINDLVAEFGGFPPDSINEYYRDGGLVSSNNPLVPLSGEISILDFYGSISEIAKTISVDQVNLVLSSLFDSAEWNSTKPKRVVIESGVTVGSLSTGIPAVRTGETVSGLTLGGVLTVVVDGFIYGAGGASTEDGGDAFLAEIPVSIENNSRIYAGGGGGGRSSDSSGYSVVYASERNVYNRSAGYYLQKPKFGVVGPYQVWWAGSLKFSNNIAPYLGRVIESSQVMYTHFFASGVEQDGDYYYLAVNRHFAEILNYDGGEGGLGAGYSQSQTSGVLGEMTILRTGIRGGAGGGFGADGLVGVDDTNNFPVATATIIPLAARVPLTRVVETPIPPGVKGKYIIGNANVTWIIQGDVLGAIA